MKKLTKLLDNTGRMAASIIARLPAIQVADGTLADALHTLPIYLKDQPTGEVIGFALPAHTHLRVGQILLDETGFMVRVDAAVQEVLYIGHDKIEAMLSVALALQAQGRAVAVQADAVIVAADAVLADALVKQGYTVASLQGKLTPVRMSLPAVADCGHEHHDHSDDTHNHSHAHDHGHDHEHHHGHKAHAH